MAEEGKGIDIGCNSECPENENNSKSEETESQESLDKIKSKGAEDDESENVTNCNGHVTVGVLGETNQNVTSRPTCEYSGGTLENNGNSDVLSSKHTDGSENGDKNPGPGTCANIETIDEKLCDTGQGDKNSFNSINHGAESDYLEKSISNDPRGSGDVSNREDSPSILVSENHSMPSQASTASSTVSSLTPSPCHSISSESAFSSPMNLTASGDSASVTTDQSEEQLLSELDAELDVDRGGNTLPPNGIINNLSNETVLEYKHLKQTLECVQKELSQCKEELNRSKEENLKHQSDLNATVKERDYYKNQATAGKDQSTEDIYIIQTKELEMTIARLEREVRAGKEKLTNHDTAAKRAITSLQTELKQQVEKAKKLVEEATREKDNMVMKYAVAEQKNIELAEKMETVEERMREMTKERENVISKFKVLKTDRDKAALAFESRQNELLKLRVEIEKHKEASSSFDMKAKWHQNKLKAEQDAHKETKTKLEDCLRKLKEAKEEAEQIRKDCQAMIKTYQESEEIKSNSLDVQLKEKEEELQLHMHERSDQEEMHRMLKVELENLKKKHKDLIEESRTWKDQVTCQETERSHQEATLDKFRETLQKQKTDITELKEKVASLEQAEIDLEIEKEKTASLEERITELETQNQDLRHDMESCSKRDEEHLVFTQKISDKNASIQSENLSLHAKVASLCEETQTLTIQLEDAEERCAKLQSELQEEKHHRQRETDVLTQRLTEKSVTVEELSRRVEEEKDEIKTMKRKHQANIKDLSRQLQQARRKLEGLENKGDGTSMGSRTSSNGSLDTSGAAAAGAQHSLPNSRASSQEPQQTPVDMVEDQPLVEVVEVDRQKLLEKIVRLQKSHARKSEKIDFLHEHVRQLVEELQKKNKVIQHYFLREEAGTISSEDFDLNKAEMAKKGGIMASLYSTHAKDGQMTLDLSLEINAKLQAVLEDTVLKNITLKDNLETLGTEIARLSKENRKIQLDKK